MSVVDLPEPLKFTTEEALKSFPLTVNVKLGPPTRAELGDILVIIGTGFWA